jgi:hypothetical protein
MVGAAMDPFTAACLLYTRADERREYEALALSVMWRIRHWELSSDDAYAWVRIVVWDAKRLHLLAPDTHDADTSPPRPPHP